MRSIFKFYIFKLAILSLTMIFISFGANAFTVEDLYKRCKPFQNNGFAFDNLSNDQMQKGLMCLSYIRGIIDLGGKNCIYLKSALKSKWIDKYALQNLSPFIANDPDVPINAAITSFVKFAENNTSKWGYSPSNYNDDFIGKDYPCK